MCNNIFLELHLKTMDEKCDEIQVESVQGRADVRQAGKLVESGKNQCTRSVCYMHCALCTMYKHCAANE